LARFEFISVGEEDAEKRIRIRERGDEGDCVKSMESPSEMEYAYEMKINIMIERFL